MIIFIIDIVSIFPNKGEGQSPVSADLRGDRLPDGYRRTGQRCCVSRIRSSGRL